MSHAPLRVLSVRDRVTDDVLKEDLQDTTGFLVDQAGDTLDTTTASKTTDSLSDVTTHKEVQVPAQ